MPRLRAAGFRLSAISILPALKVSLMSLTPGNVGTHQVITIFVLGLFAVPAADALAFSLGLQGAVHLTMLSLAGLVLYQEGLSLGEWTASRAPAA